MLKWSGFCKISRTFTKETKLSLRRGTVICRTGLTRGISYSTTRRVLKKKELTASLAVKKQFCLKWCKERRNWSLDKWRSVIFTDVSNFELLNSGFGRRKTLQQGLIRPRTQGGGGP